MEQNNSIIFFKPGMYFHNDYVWLGDIMVVIA
jgi:hypothetical protein